MLRPRGKRSTEAKRRVFVELDAKLDVQVGHRDKPTRAIVVRAYKYLGVTHADSGKLGTEVAHRLGSAKQAHRPIPLSGPTPSGLRGNPNKS